MISTVIVAFSMFSAIPMPQTEWTNKKYALCVVRVPADRRSDRRAGVPVAFCVPADGIFGMDTGGGNLCTSGTCDRRHSSGWLLRYGRCAGKSSGYRKKTTDFKGPAYGARSAAIWLGCYFIAQLALAVTAAQMQADLTALAFGYCISRSLSGLAVASFLLRKTVVWHILLQSTRIKKKVRTFLAVLAAVLCVLCCICCGKKGIGVSIAAIGTFLYYRFRLIGKFRRPVGGPGRMVCPDVRTFHAGSSGTDRVSVVRQKNIADAIL